MGYWKMGDFTRAELARVDQEQYADELYVLRHSPAACRVFAKAQWYLNLERGADDESASALFGAAMELFHTIEDIACEVAHRHPIAYHRWNPRRRWVPSSHRFVQLALGLESKPDEHGDETFVRTIEGWWKV